MVVVRCSSANWRWSELDLHLGGKILWLGSPVVAHVNTHQGVVVVQLLGKHPKSMIRDLVGPQVELLEPRVHLQGPGNPEAALVANPVIVQPQGFQRSVLPQQTSQDLTTFHTQLVITETEKRRESSVRPSCKRGRRS